MKKLLFILGAICILFPLNLNAQLPQKIAPTRNIILMIADGTSLPTVSLARWYQRYLNPQAKRLHLDSLLSGTVLTHCSDSPIGDSAPTTSCYMTGIASQKNFVATYPVATHHDLFEVDPNRAYQPLVTLLEAGKWLYNKRAGLVVTCEFTHATPADCAAHTYNRRRYDWIAPQMVNLPVDVMIGGGTEILTPPLEKELKRQGIPYIADNLSAFRSYQGEQLWALFGKKDMPYDLDRDPNLTPTLAESTQKALELLDNPSHNGFFLMVEGSKIDWAAHANDPVGLATEMLAFDRAIGVAMDFARRDGNTTIIVVADHGNSGISIGLERYKKGDTRGADELLGQLTSIRRTADGLAQMLNAAPQENARELFRKYAAIDLNEEELQALYQCPEYKHSPIEQSQRKGDNAAQGLYNGKLSAVVTQIYQQHLPIGFTSHGHTGEEVFLGSYHPQGDRPMGMILNTELNYYLASLWGLEEQLPSLTDLHFAPHAQVLQGYSYQVVGNTKGTPEYLAVQLAKNKVLRIHPFSRKVTVGTPRQYKTGKYTTYHTPSNAVWVDKNQTFYIHRDILKMVGVLY